jgi:hypothetical protein
MFSRWRMLSSVTAAMKRRPKQNLLKLTSALVVLSIIAIVYGQHLLSSGIEDQESLEIIMETSFEETARASQPKPIPAASALSFKSAILDANDDVPPRKKPKYFDEREQYITSPRYVADSAVKFLDTRKPTAQTVKLQDWVQKMSSTVKMVVYDQNEPTKDPKEYLFPCSQDQYSLSDSIQESGVTGMIEGKL